MRALDELKKEMSVVLAKAYCKNITSDEVHELIDEILSEYNIE